MQLGYHQIQQAISGLIAAFPELEDDEKLRIDMLEGSTDCFEFLQTLAHQIADTQTHCEALDLRIKELRERKERFERRIEAVRAMMFNVMQNAGLKKAELATATLSVRPGTPKVIVTDEAALPDTFIRIKREPDKIAIKERLAAGEIVPGAELSNAEPSLAIRVK